MSETSSEKQMEDTTSLDEDSGHDSVDEISSERERIACLETAVNWIRDEVTQLKDYDRDILQELWRIRNTIHTIRDVHKRVKKEESRFLDDTIEDRSPTPESQLEQIQEELKPEKHQEQDRSDVIISPESNEQSPPLSPVQSPEFMNSEGERYRTGTLQLMATAPNHMKKSSDEKLLEEFFGSDQVNKLGIFNSQTSLNNGESGATSETDKGRVLQGVSMPNISSAPSSSPLTAKSRKQLQQRSPYQQHESNQPVQRRLQIPKNPNTDANRISYDVAFEMEKLRARLQETAIQELAEFDRKYSPKLLHTNHAGGSDGWSGEVSLNHSRQGSLDSSLSSQPTSSTDLINPVRSVAIQGHSRQHSLPIDPKYYRQLQHERSNDSTPPNISPRGMRAGVVIGRKISSSHVPSSKNEKRSPSPPTLGHVSQVSVSSVASENGATSPPLVVRSDYQFPDGDPKLPGKQSKPPGMTRVPSNGSNPSHNHHHHSSSYSSGGVSAYNSCNSNNRYSPESQFAVHPRSQTVSQPHYATGALKRGKRNSGEITSEQVGTYQSYQYQQLHHSQPQLQQQAGSARLLAKSQSYEEKVKAGFRPHTYDKPVVRGQGDALNQDNRGGMLTVAGYQEGGRPPPHPRNDSSNIAASPKLARMLVTGRPSSAVTSRQGSTVTSRPGSAYNGKVGGGSHPLSTDDIQPYMTSSQLKQQMKFTYTPFTSHQQSQQQSQQRAYSMSTAEPPRLQKKGGGGGGGGRNADQRTWI